MFVIIRNLKNKKPLSTENFNFTGQTNPYCVIFFIWVLLQKFALADQEEIKNLEPLVVTASRIMTTAEHAPGSVTVINRTEIQEQNPRSIIELLRKVPGLHIDQPGGYGGLSSVYIRGGDPNFTAIMLDGVKLNDPTDSRGGSYDLSSINVDSIERIEVVRGPLSYVYGSGALTGVINIITREGGGKQNYSVRTEIGNKDFYQANVHASGSLAENDYAVGARYLDSGDSVLGHKYMTRSINAKMNLVFGEQFWSKWSARYSKNKGERYPDDSGGPKFAVFEETESRDSDETVVSAEFGYKHSGMWQSRFRGSWYQRKDEITSPGVAPGSRDPFGIPASNTDSNFEQTNLAISTEASLLDSLNIVIGADARFESGGNDSFLFFSGMPFKTDFDLRRSIYGGFLETQFFPTERLILHGGFRVDYPDDFENKVTARVGAVYTFPVTDTTVKVGWGEGFKLPSFFALGHPIVGNPALKPEQSESVQLELVQGFWKDDLLVRLHAFHNRFKNIVDFDEGPPPRLVNRSEVTAKGIELELKYKWDKSLGLDIHVTYVDTNINGSDEELRNRPKWRGGSNFTWYPSQDWHTNLSTYYVGSVADSSIPTGDKNLDAYYRVDFASTWQVEQWLDLSIAIDNLLDTHYEEAVGIPGPGIQFRFNVVFSLDG